MTQEFEAASETLGLTVNDFEKITINAMKSAFLPYDRRIDFIYSIIKPGYARIRESKPALTREYCSECNGDLMSSFARQLAFMLMLSCVLARDGSLRPDCASWANSRTDSRQSCCGHDV